MEELLIYGVLGVLGSSFGGFKVQSLKGLGFGVLELRFRASGLCGQLGSARPGLMGSCSQSR